MLVSSSTTAMVHSGSAFDGHGRFRRVADADSGGQDGAGELAFGTRRDAAGGGMARPSFPAEAGWRDGAGRHAGEAP